MKKLILLFTVLMAVAYISRSAAKFTIAPKTVRCTGIVSQNCMQVKMDSKPVLSPKKEKDILDTILNISDIKSLAFGIARQTNGNICISAIISPDDSDSLYCIKVGLNGFERFETVYTFYINKKTNNITVLNPITGGILPLSLWKKKNQQFTDGDNFAFDSDCDKPFYLQLVPLPFNWNKWNNWYNQEYTNLPKESVFNYYKVSDNEKLDRILTLNPLRDGFVPYLYFVLDQRDNYQALLLFSGFHNRDYNKIRDKFYDVITIKNNSIISYLQVGFLADNNEDGMSFNIDKDLKIKIYNERMAFESYGAVPIDTFNISTYQIQENGMIVKTID